MQFRVYVCVCGGEVSGCFGPCSKMTTRPAGQLFGWLAGRWSAVCFSFFWSSCLEKGCGCCGIR